MEKFIIQITSGRGPHECTWVVAQVLRELLREANLKGYEAKVISKVDGHFPATVESAFLEITGHKAMDFVSNWIGSIQWIGQSPYRKFHKRKNWFIGIFKVDNTSVIELNENDVIYQAIRSAGPGGQNVNKVSTCIRATHKPSGLQVIAMDTRSQHQNKKLAFERLKAKIEGQYYSKLQDEIAAQWMNQMQIERGNSIKTFEGPKFKKIN
jgi:peptide chain release factor